MINDEICKVREKLNSLIENCAPYDEIYKVSVELDELIVQYYREKSNM